MANDLQRYGTYTKEMAKQEQREMGQTDWFKPVEGKNKVRFLPGPPGKSPFYISRQHRVEIPGEKYPKRFECPGKGCPVCAESARLGRTGNPRDREAAYQLQAKARVYANIISRKEPERGILVYEFGKTVKSPLDKLLDEDMCGDFAHPLTGTDIIIEREGTGQNDTEYTVFPVRQSSRLAESDDQINEWLDARRDLPGLAPRLSVDEIRKLMGSSGEEDAPLPERKPRRHVAEEVVDAEVTGEASSSDDLDV